MRIGLYTFFDSSDNYGQVLQAYALQHYLQKQGHDVFIIDYIMRLIVRKQSVLSNKLSFQQRLKSFIRNNTIKRYRLWRGQQFRKLYPCDLDSFRRSYLNIVSPSYLSAEQIQKNPPVADAFICGSDQVWNTGVDNTASIAFLNFGNKEAKRIAYAPSFGRFIQTPEKIQFLSEQLKRFDAVSARETTGLDICHKAGRKDAILVADPTFLLCDSDYSSLYDSTKNQWSNSKRLFCYFLSIKRAEDVNWSKIVEFSQSGNYDVRVSVSSGFLPAMPYFGNIDYYSPTPGEWIQSIEQCDAFITNSFHGVAFAINLKRKFLFMPFSGKSEFMNNRLISLLSQLSLTDRIYNPNKCIADQLDKDIDWDTVHKKLDEMRNISINYLAQALG